MENNLTSILEGCRKGERRYQQALYETYYRQAFAICHRYVRDREEALETMHDGFMKVFTHIRKFIAPADPGLLSYFFMAWLKRIMINAAVDHQRAHKGFQHYVEITEATGDGLAFHPTDQFSYEDLMKMIRSLPPAYRAVFNLHVIDGYSHDEISNMLGISASTSRSNLTKAKEYLRKLLNESYEKVLAKYN